MRRGAATQVKYRMTQQPCTGKQGGLVADGATHSCLCMPLALRGTARSMCAASLNSESCTHTLPASPSSSINIKQNCQPAGGGGGSAAISAVCRRSSTTGPQGRCNILRARAAAHSVSVPAAGARVNMAATSRHPVPLVVGGAGHTKPTSACVHLPKKHQRTSRKQYVHTHGLKTAAGQHDTHGNAQAMKHISR